MAVLTPPWHASPPPWTASSSFTSFVPPAIPPFPTSQSPASFAGPHRFNTFPPTHGHAPSPGPSAFPFSTVPPKNNKPLDRAMLHQVLEFFATCIAASFGTGRVVRLVIHGGAVMLLNHSLSYIAAQTSATDRMQRSTTRDIDFIQRSFASEWASRYGVYDAPHRLRQCILRTAERFQLGADWMNSDADVALPMATDAVTGALYDPIYAASMTSDESLVVYTSPNGLLELVSVTPYWTVALKMVRFNAADRSDICILLRSGTYARGLHWTPARLEVWLLGTAWAMGYAGYDAQRVATMRRRMVEVVEEVNRWDPDAVMDDGMGGVVPLRPGSRGVGMGSTAGAGYAGMYAPPAPWLQQQRNTSPFHPTSTSPPSYPYPQTAFIPPPPVSPPTKKEKKERKRREKEKERAGAVTTWPSAWTQLADPGPSSSSYYPPTQPQAQSWDPEHSPDRWAADVRRQAKEERRTGVLAGWLPFRRRSEAREVEAEDEEEEFATISPEEEDGEEDWENISDNESVEDTDTDTDSEDDPDESWLEAQRRRWGTSGRLPGTRQRTRSRSRSRRRAATAPKPLSTTRARLDGAGSTPMHMPGIQLSIASFMSGGMDAEQPVEAPQEMAAGGRGQYALPSWDRDRGGKASGESRRATRPLTAAASAPLIPPPLPPQSPSSTQTQTQTQSLAPVPTMSPAPYLDQLQQQVQPFVPPLEPPVNPLADSESSYPYPYPSTAVPGAFQPQPQHGTQYQPQPQPQSQTQTQTHLAPPTSSRQHRPLTHAHSMSHLASYQQNSFASAAPPIPMPMPRQNDHRAPHLRVPDPPRVHPGNPWTYYHQQTLAASQLQAQAQAQQSQPRRQMQVPPMQPQPPASMGLGLGFASGINGTGGVGGTRSPSPQREVVRRIGALGLY
ncbi:hypothetical protein MKEN_00016300 [Mycena kentingensis (nom. inval.)]|nr:hypothetical protein MKEN_00016300 [Mycena kentingensis (nom. inval.)]